MKNTLILLLGILSISAHAASMAYPKSPNLNLTPGSLCDTPSRYRHPERIAYCERDVSSFLKETVIISYRKELGYSLSGDRSDFKIDHFIPLCAGGSNKQNNLWPQHNSVFKITDPVESMGCEKLSLGKIKQRDFINLIMKVKLNLEEAPRAFKYLKSLR